MNRDPANVPNNMTLAELLGTDLPLIQAPMAGSQGHVLAAAVSNAGGLGSLPCALLDADGLRRELTALRARTSRSFNVNFFCHVPPQPDPAREAAWRKLLAPYYEELGVAPDAVVAGPARAPFNAAAADLLEEFRPRVVSFHFGLPAPDLLARVKAMGAVVLSSATTVDEAHWLERHGVDAVIAQGVEAGGHRGIFLSDDLDRQPRMLDLVAEIAGAVRIPVIAAGGISTADAVAAARRAGAAGVQVGTAYLRCPEATTSAVHRAALTERRATALTNLMSGRPARGIVNRLMSELGPIHAAAPAFPLASGAIAPLRAKAEARGSGDFSPLWAGEAYAFAEELPAAEVTRKLAAGL